MSLIYHYCILQLFIISIQCMSTDMTTDKYYGTEVNDELTETTILNESFITMNENDESETTTEPIILEDFADDLRDLNKDFDRLGKIYVTQYYNLFDDPKKRLSLVALYHPNDSLMTFDGERYRGTKRILEKFEKLKLKNLTRKISSIDIQPLLDGGIIVNVIGKVHENDNPDHLYAQTFIYKPQKGSFFLQHDIFRVIRP